MAKFRLMIDEKDIRDPRVVPILRQRTRAADQLDIFFLTLASLIGFVVGMGM